MSALPSFLRRGGPDFSTPPVRRATQTSIQVLVEDDVLEDANDVTVQAVQSEIDGPEADVQETSGIPPIYVGGARLLDQGVTARSGMTVELLLRDVGPREVHPFKGLKWGKSQGQRLKTWIGPYSELAEINQLDELESMYSGETQLTYYGDTCSKGVTIKMLLDNGPDGVRGVNPFHEQPIGPIEGMDLFVSFWAINDDETVIPKKAARKSTPFHQLSEVRQANTLVNDEEFVNFLYARLHRLVGEARPDIQLADNPKEWAKEIVRIHLDVESLKIMNLETIEGVEPRKRWKLLASEYFQSEEFHARRYFLGR
ncbi:hypothetical protein O9X98_07375 [Agrobacterium salinitolerans]|nr:hypothetical protein [Agrobacterium salinitolerans]